MDTQLLEQARIAKAKADSEQALIDALPGLEREAAEAKRAVEIAEKMQLAQQMFNEAIEAHKQRDQAFTPLYSELRQAFRSFIQMLKSDNRSYNNVWNNAMHLGYYLAAEDQVFGLSADSQRAHAQQLMKDYEIENVTLPQPKDGIDNYFNIAIQEALKVP